VRPDAAAPVAYAQRGDQKLFVANFNSNAVSIYNAATGALKGAISQPQPLRLLFADGRTLFVATDQQHGEVGVYAWGSFNLIAAITDQIDGPRALAFAKGNLYVGNSSSSGNWVSVYAAPYYHYVTTFDNTKDGIDTIAADAQGNIYVAQTTTVGVYSPSGELLRTISDGVSCPNLLSFDQAGDLFVANFVSNQGHCTGNIYVYPSGKNTPKYVIRSGLDGPVAMAFDRKQNLYVANSVNSTVTVYPPGKVAPNRTISQGLSAPTAIAISSPGVLYVSSDGNGLGAVSVYPPGMKKPSMTITDGIDVPVGLALK
jgi:sugar lactone lactonase YvrE